jgi:hypothetical protein
MGLVSYKTAAMLQAMKAFMPKSAPAGGNLAVLFASKWIISP